MMNQKMFNHIFLFPAKKYYIYSCTWRDFDFKTNLNIRLPCVTATSKNDEEDYNQSSAESLITYLLRFRNQMFISFKTSSFSSVKSNLSKK